MLQWIYIANVQLFFLTRYNLNVNFLLILTNYGDNIKKMLTICFITYKTSSNYLFFNQNQTIPTRKI